MLPLEQVTGRVVLTLDKRLGGGAIREFNELLLKQVETRIPPTVPLDIFHQLSHENKPLLAVDLFAWGIYRKHEVGDTEW